MQIDILVGSTRQGSGPITSATGWTDDTQSLDKIGAFSFSCSATDPQASEIQALRVVDCYEDGVLRCRGRIEKIEQSTDGLMLGVSGQGIAVELTDKTVGNLALSEPGWSTAVGVFEITISPIVESPPGGGSGPPAGQGTLLVNKPLAWDGNASTYEYVGQEIEPTDTTPDINTSDGGNRWQYIGSAEAFNKIHFVCNTVYTYSTRGRWGYAHWRGFALQYFDGTDWVNTQIDTDTTILDGDSFRLTGDMEFATPTPMKQTTEQGISAYFIRGRFEFPTQGPGEDHETGVRWYEVQCWNHIPTDTALSIIAAKFPAGWSLDTTHGESFTVKEDVYGLLAGESVFEALLKLSELCGEHFYTTSDRKVCWIGQPGGYLGAMVFQTGDEIPRLTSVPVPRLVEGDPYTALLTSCKVVSDSHGTITRVYPQGAGLGDGMLTLAHCTKAAPAGYVLNKTENYVRLDPEGSVQIDKAEQFKDIGPETPDQRAREYAANQLLDAALVYLARHSAAQVTYSLSVTNLTPGILRPGDFVWVDYTEYRGGQRVFSVNDMSLRVLEIAQTIGQGEAIDTRLTVSTLCQWPVTDVELLARMYRQVANLSRYPQSVGIGNVHTGDFAVSGQALTTGGGGLAYGGSSPASGGTGVGGLAAHQLTGGYHTETGLTAGHYLRAESATSFAFSSIADADLPATLSRAPGTLTAATTNSATSPHTHAVTASSAPGETASLLKTASDGSLTLDKLNVGQTSGAYSGEIKFGDSATVYGSLSGYEGEVALESSAGSMLFNRTVPTTSTLIGQPSAAAANGQTEFTLCGPSVAYWRDKILVDGTRHNSTFTDKDLFYELAGTSVMHVRNAAEADVLAVHQNYVWASVLNADQMYVKSFIADLEQALAGSQIIAKSVTPLAAAFTVPAKGSTASLVVREFPGQTAHVFVDADWVRVRNVARGGAPGSALSVTDAYGTVVYASRDATNKTQTYTFTRDASDTGNAATSVPWTVIAAESLVLDYGVTTNGYIESTTLDTAGAPYVQINTWATRPSNATVKTRIGNLAGITDAALSPSGYGLYSDNAFLKGSLTAGRTVITPDGGITVSFEDYADSQIKWKTGGTVNFLVGPVTQDAEVFATISAPGPLRMSASYYQITGDITHVGNLTSGGVNVGSVTGAAAGEVKTSAAMYPGGATRKLTGGAAATLADDGTRQISMTHGLLVVTADDWGQCGVYVCGGAADPVMIGSTTSTLWGVGNGADNDGHVRVWYLSGSYYIVNRSGASRVISWYAINA